ncbi:MAG: hypothetical protein WC845_04205 [Candidatus Staskawiczbacteria bacterium]|jgi:hypothetical protein
MKTILLILGCITLTSFLGFAGSAFASTDLSITNEDISLSKTEALDGETVRIFVRVFNIGDTDVKAFITISNNGKQIGEPQSVSAKANTYDDVFVDYKFKADNNKIEASLTGIAPADENSENNKIITKDYFVDLDTDGDAIGNSKDADDDNDGIPDDLETAQGTNPLNPDTDGDKVPDSIDAFPTDKTESSDIDKDDIGDNKDTDDDGDGLSDEEETYQYGTNPSNPDTDNDGLGDGKEIEFKTDPEKTDTDNDGTIDSQDKNPLVASIAQASMMGAVADWFAANPYAYAIMGAFGVLIIFLLFHKKKEK